MHALGVGVILRGGNSRWGFAHALCQMLHVVQLIGLVE